MPKQTPTPILAKVINEARKAGALSQEMLAEKLATNQSTVSGWERDEACPDLPMLCDLAKVLGVDRDVVIDAALDYYTRFAAGQTHLSAGKSRRRG